MLSLEKGKTVSLSKTSASPLKTISMGLGWDAKEVVTKGWFGRVSKERKDVDLDASCLLFNAAGRLIDEVWFRQLRSKDGSVSHSGDNRTGDGDGDDETIFVDLAKLPADVRSLVFTVNSWTGESFEEIENAYCRAVDSVTGKELARYSLGESGPHTGLVMLKLARDGDGWSVTAIGEPATGRSFHDMLPVISRHI
jgi:tellurium resistance protein TerZ